MCGPVYCAVWAWGVQAMQVCAFVCGVLQALYVDVLVEYHVRTYVYTMFHTALIS